MTADQLAMLQEQGKTPENLPRYKHLDGERPMRTAELYAAVMRLTEPRGLGSCTCRPAPRRRGDGRT